MQSRPEKLRVLNVIYRPLQVGGAEKASVDLATNLDRARYESSFCALARPAAIPWRTGQLETAGVHLHRIDRRTAKDPVALRRFARFLKHGQFDIVHAHLWDAHVWTALALLGSAAPVFVAHEHTWSFEGEPRRRFIDRNLIGRRADAFIAVSESDRQNMIKTVGLPASKIHVIPNGIEAQALGVREQVRGELRIAAAAPVIATVANMRPQKRLDILIRAAAILRPLQPDLQILIAGERDPAAATELQSLIGHLGLDGHIHLLGGRSDIANILAAADVACLSSDYEGMPLALLEYMAAAKPIVATSVGGIPEVIENRREGLLIPRGDPAALASAITRLLDDRDWAEAMGLRAQAKQRQRHSLQSFVNGVERLYEHLNDTASTRPTRHNHPSPTSPRSPLPN